jgi:hypothetical protein
LEIYPSRNSPTDSAEEPDFSIGFNNFVLTASEGLREPRQGYMQRCSAG